MWWYIALHNSKNAIITVALICHVIHVLPRLKTMWNAFPSIAYSLCITNYNQLFSPVFTCKIKRKFSSEAYVILARDKTLLLAVPLRIHEKSRLQFLLPTTVTHMLFGAGKNPRSKIHAVFDFSPRFWHVLPKVEIISNSEKTFCFEHPCENPWENCFTWS